MWTYLYLEQSTDTKTSLPSFYTTTKEVIQSILVSFVDSTFNHHSPSTHTTGYSNPFSLQADKQHFMFAPKIKIKQFQMHATAYNHCNINIKTNSDPLHAPNNIMNAAVVSVAAALSNRTHCSHGAGSNKTCCHTVQSVDCINHQQLTHNGVQIIHWSTNVGKRLGWFTSFDIKSVNPILSFSQEAKR